jgi:hypothetical protein
MNNPMKKQKIAQNKPITKSLRRKLLAIPGIIEAISTVKRHAYYCAFNETWIEKLGKRKYNSVKLRDLINKTEVDGDIKEEWLEYLALEAGPKIAEIWNLSEGAGDRLAGEIYWGDTYWQSETPSFQPFTLVVEVKDQDKGSALTNTFQECEQELVNLNTWVTSSENIKPNHIYLDMTYLPHSALQNAYKSVVLCRKCLGISPSDLREGAPEAIDTKKALESAELKSQGKNSKEIARELGFRIYTTDNPSGNYPLFRKYLKRGKEILQRLDDLEGFLDDVIIKRYDTK